MWIVLYVAMIESLRAIGLAQAAGVPDAGAFGRMLPVNCIGRSFHDRRGANFARRLSQK